VEFKVGIMRGTTRMMKDVYFTKSKNLEVKQSVPEAQFPSYVFCRYSSAT
jgi:hypothetical protein